MRTWPIKILIVNSGKKIINNHTKLNYSWEERSLEANVENINLYESFSLIVFIINKGSCHYYSLILNKIF